MDFVEDFAEIIIFTLLYYFIFELQDLKNKFESDDATSYTEKFKKFKFFRAMAIAWNATVSSASVLISIYLVFTRDGAKDHSSLNALLYGQIILKVCQIIVDLIMASLFAFLFVFFVKMKIAKSELLGESLTPKSKRAIFLTSAVFIMNLNSSLCRLFHCTEINHLIETSSMNSLKLM